MFLIYACLVFQLVFRAFLGVIKVAGKLILNKEIFASLILLATTESFTALKVLKISKIPLSMCVNRSI